MHHRIDFLHTVAQLQLIEIGVRGHGIKYLTGIINIDDKVI